MEERIVTNAYDVWGTNDPSGLSWLSFDTNSVPTTNFYKAVSGSTNVVSTITNFNGYSWRCSPMAWYSRYEIEYTNRYIWGTYSNLICTSAVWASTLGGSNFIFAGYQMVNYLWHDSPAQYVTTLRADYTNAGGWTMYDYGQLIGNLDISHDPWDVLDEMASARLEKTPVVYETYRGDSPVDGPWRDTGGNIQAGLVFRGANLIAGKVRDGIVTRRLRYTNSLDRIVSVIRHGHAGGDVDLLDTVSGKIVYKVVDDSSPGLLYAGRFLDDTLSTAGQYYGQTDLADCKVSATGLWVRLGIGYTGLYDRVYFSDQELNTYAITNYSIETNDWAERYKALHALKWTYHGGVAENNWTNDGMASEYNWQGESTSSWAAAKAVATTNITSVVTNSQRPRVYTFGYVSVGVGGITTWQANAKSVRGKLCISGLNTNIRHGTDFYALTVPPSIGDDAWGTQNNIVSNATYLRYFTNAYDYAGSVTSAWLGQTSFPSAWCSEPTNVALGTSLGFVVNGEEMVFKWEFEHCTNSL